jgi:diacylglycerol kinase family enzyme
MRSPRDGRQKKGIRKGGANDSIGMIVLINPRAGKSGKTATRPETRIAELFAALGETPRIVQPRGGSELTALAREAARSSEQTIVAAGGDGTVSTVAGELAGTQKTLGVLPIGTLNHFAKDLRIPLDLAAAVHTIVHGRVMSIDAGEVNGRIFINNSSLGIYPEIVSRRVLQQQRLGRSKWPAFFTATMHAFRRFPFLHLQIQVEGRQLARTTPFLFVGNNEYQIAGFHIGSRPRLDAGLLGLYLTQRTSRLGLIGHALRVLFGLLNQAKDFEVFTVTEARIKTHRRGLLVAWDGEIAWMATPLHYRTRPGALRVLVPKDTV